MEYEDLCETLKIVDLRPDDVIILKCQVSITSETANRLRNEIRKHFGAERKVYVLSDGLDIEIVRPGIS